jgi:pectin methylesterase-like acyl-CoA thioesterase
MVKYALLSLGVAGLLMLGEGLAPQVTWPTGQQERFVVRVPEDFPTIQAAIDAVAEGGTVLIGPGTYQENVKITKEPASDGASQEHVNIQARKQPITLQPHPTVFEPLLGILG